MILSKGWFTMEQIPLSEVFSELRTIKWLEKYWTSVWQEFPELNEFWLSRYSKPWEVNINKSSEFNLHVAMLCKQFKIFKNPTMSKNLQVNSIIKSVYQVLVNMLCTNAAEDNDHFNPDIIKDFVTNSLWTVCSTYQSVLCTLVCTKCSNTPKECAI